MDWKRKESPRIHASRYATFTRLFPFLLTCLLLVEDFCDAAWKGDYQLIQRMLEHPLIADFINCPNSRGQSALYCACRRGHVQIVLYLLRSDILILDHQVESTGNTPLHGTYFLPSLQLSFPRGSRQRAPRAGMNSRAARSLSSSCGL